MASRRPPLSPPSPSPPLPSAPPSPPPSPPPSADLPPLAPFPLPLLAALSPDAAERRAAEAQLAQLASLPGFCSSLLSLTRPPSDETTRLLAATTLKNQLERRWRAGPRAIAAAERAPLRDDLLRALHDASPSLSLRVARQLALAAAWLVRSEANAREPLLLPALSRALLAPRAPHGVILAWVHSAKALRSLRLPHGAALCDGVGRGVAPPLVGVWREAVALALAGGALEEVWRAALLSRAVRQALAMCERRGEAEAGAEAGAEGGGVGGVRYAALEAAVRAHARCFEACGEARRAWGCVARRCGKLAAAVARRGGGAWRRAAAAAAAAAVVAEAEERAALRRGEWGALEAREAEGSACVAHLAAVVEALREWEADPEGFACAGLLPSVDEATAEEGEGEEEEEEGEEGEEEGGGGGGWEEEGDEEEEEGGGGGGARVPRVDGGGRAEVLQRRAEQALSSLLCGAYAAAARRALLALLPSAASAASDSLATQIGREAAYSALGVCAWSLQHHLSFRRLLHAAVAEARGAAPLPLAGPLQARLPWLLRCWWGFGGGDDDEACCVGAYALLRDLIAHGHDVAVRLQAALALHAILRSAMPEDLALFAPMAPQVCVGLGATLAACETDEARIWLLRILRKLTQQLPGLWLHPETQASLPAVLGALWEQAATEHRPLLSRELKRLSYATAASPIEE
ncbi:hypothetical protein AB1Y20_011819 [Prymnesium parvum]|uniref:Importin N-terminal domain-containing protein n=1 Tax=Prymnesium parvum TaxID=97485 RepID=A0AB34IHL5_PRYPA